MIRLIIEVILILASFAGGWYCKGKFGLKAQAIVDAVDTVAKP